jgi:glycosyltransferase involved in cell wall biosynthesis
VAVLLATLNGAAFLSEQVASIRGQSHPELVLVASDDGSSDGTTALLRDAAQGMDHAIRSGPGRGSTANFLSLLGDPLAAEAGYVAFSDQDDVWFPDKIARAVASLSRAGARPALYCARTIVTDAALRPLGPSPLFRRRPGFGNALVQCIGGGNTMVLNPAARALVARSAGRVAPVCHDWWCYQLVSGAGGTVIYDPEPVLFYRQHDANQLGANRGALAAARRFAAALGGRYAGWNAANIAALRIVADELLPENRQILNDFAALRTVRGATALSALRRTGLWRQTWAGTLSLYGAALLGRL